MFCAPKIHMLTPHTSMGSYEEVGPLEVIMIRWGYEDGAPMNGTNDLIRVMRELASLLYSAMWGCEEE